MTATVAQSRPDDLESNIKIDVRGKKSTPATAKSAWKLETSHVSLWLYIITKIFVPSLESLKSVANTVTFISI